MELLFPAAAAVCVLAGIAYGVYQCAARRGVGSIPTLVGYIPVLGVALQYGGSGMAYLQSVAASYGPTFRLLLGGERRIFLTNVLDHAQVLKDTDMYSFKVIEDEITTRVVGVPVSLVAAANDDFIHSLWVKHLQGRGLQSSNARMASLLASHLLHRHAGQQEWVTLPARAWSSAALFSVGSRVVFGPSLRSEAIVDDLNLLDDGFPLLVAGAPGWMTARHIAAMLRLKAEVLRQQVEDWDAVSDLIRERVLHFKSHGYDDDACAAVNVLTLWALQANTAPVIFWSIAHILHDATAYTALRNEVDAMCDADGAWWTEAEGLAKRLDALRGVTSAVNEAMRICGTSASIRQVMKDSSIAGAADGVSHNLAAGERVILLSTHQRDPRVFEQPHAFKFDRFMPLPDGSPRAFTTPDGQALRTPVAAFGGGVSMCPGRFLAMNEVRLFLVLALRFLDMQAAPGSVIPQQDASRTGLGMLPPKTDMNIRIRWRGITPPAGAA